MSDWGTFRLSSEEPSGEPRKILIADANQGFRGFMRHLLEKNQDLALVTEAADGEGAVSVARHLKPQVVLVDIDLPKAGGLETTRRIKAELPQTRVILLSAVDGNVYRDAAKSCGADAFLLKGVPVSEVLSVIRHGTAPSAA